MLATLQSYHIEKASQGTSSPKFKWAYTLWGPEARWLQEPDMSLVLIAAQTALKLDPTAPCSMKFLAQGAFNKLYVVSSSGKDYVFRVTLPIFPKWKTESEVATMEWVRRTLPALPAPHVYAYIPDQSNDVGFEWIIMEKVRGKTLADAWRELDFSAKEAIVRRIAAFASDAFQHQTRGIGSLFYSKCHILETFKPSFSLAEPLYTASASDANLDSIVLGPCSSPAFISPCTQPVPHGPFISTRDWIFARIDFALADCCDRMEVAQQSSEDMGQDSQADDSDGSENKGEDPEDLENAIGILKRLRPLVDSFFPSGESAEPEPSMVFHDDLNKRNILVDETEPGSITAVLDWESITTVPLFLGCQYPPLLEGRPSEEQPDRAEYQEDENGDVPELYWESLEMYELTQLRSLFLAEMRRMQPGWAEVFDASQRQRDFDLAISSADDLFSARRLRNWLTDLESGATDVRGLEERIDQNTV